MFTGIISKTSIIKATKQDQQGLTLTLIRPKSWKIKKGDSISINGVCATVISSGKDMVFQLMPETLKKTNLASLKAKQTVNLEQSLTLASRLDGHLVVGHVDEVGTIKSIKEDGNSKIFTISVKSQGGLLAPKGSVTVDGISLTVVSVKNNQFTVHIIPYTLTHTNLGTKLVGQTVNIEYDLMAKYIKQLLKK